MPDTEQLRAYLADCDVPCPGCGYNLRGVTEPVCPECEFGLTLELHGRNIDRDRRVKLTLFLIPLSMAIAGTISLAMWVRISLQVGATSLWSTTTVVQICAAVAFWVSWITLAICLRHGGSSRAVRALGIAFVAYALFRVVAMIVSFLM
ncbi:MAG: hypothetical protein AAGJ54_10910 [Planctomycetota bacterium]